MLRVIVVWCVSLASAQQDVEPGLHRDEHGARPLPLPAVRLTGGPLKHAQDLDAKYLRELEPDRMLAYYRERARLKPKAKPYGGWDGAGRNLTGHIGGHYLSAVSLMWAATGDERFKQRADYMVRELKEVQDKLARRIKVCPDLTLYSRYGDVIIFILVFLLLVLFAYTLRPKDFLDE